MYTSFAFADVYVFNFHLYSSKCCKCHNTSAIYVFLTYIFFFCKLQLEDTQKNPHCINLKNATTKSNNFNLSPVIVFTHMSLRLHKFMKERLN